MPDQQEIGHRPRIGAAIAARYKAEGMNVGEAIVLARIALDVIEEEYVIITKDDRDKLLDAYAMQAFR